MDPLTPMVFGEPVAGKTPNPLEGIDFSKIPGEIGAWLKTKPGEALEWIKKNPVEAAGMGVTTALLGPAGGLLTGAITKAGHAAGGKK